MSVDERLEEVEQYWKGSRGKALMLKFLKGERLTRDQSIKAKCAECMNGYMDGRIDCGITTCPLYPYSPYREQKAKRHTQDHVDRQEAGKWTVQ